LSAIFSIDVAAYAVMNNHYHLVLRVDAERARDWSVEEVLERWMRLFNGPLLVQRYQSPARETMTEAEIERVRAFAEEYRQRLVNISWFMRILNENIARQANQEDQVKGHFWEGRFKSQALLDETALLSAMAYVDLNPIRAGMAATPEASDYTSLQARLVALTEDDQSAAVEVEPVQELLQEAATSISEVVAEEALTEEAAEEVQWETPNSPLKPLPWLADLSQAPLMPFDATGKFEQAIPFGFQDYLELVDTVGRTIRLDKRGAISPTTPKILVRLEIDTDAFIAHASRFLKEFGHAVGRPETLVAHADKRQTKFLRGMATARAVCRERLAA
jgi:REP element-mobilizing transposase RayT